MSQLSRHILFPPPLFVSFVLSVYPKNAGDRSPTCAHNIIRRIKHTTMKLLVISSLIGASCAFAPLPASLKGTTALQSSNDPEETNVILSEGACVRAFVQSSVDASLLLKSTGIFCYSHLMCLSCTRGAAKLQSELIRLGWCCCSAHQRMGSRCIPSLLWSSWIRRSNRIL
jgi:hypothetical protein